MKRSKIITSLVIIIFINTVHAQGIQFYKGDFKGAIAQAKKENKLVFVDFYTTWCGPCKRMDAYIFPDENVGTYFNDKFVSIKIDAEKGEGIGLAKKYSIKAYPTLLYLNTDKTEKGRLVGATPTADFFINYTKQALGETENFISLYEKYKQQETKDLKLEQKILAKGPIYAQSIKDRNERWLWSKKFAEISKKYFKSKPLNKFLNKEDFKLITQYLDGPNNGHPVVEFVYDHYEEYKKMVPIKELARYILRTNNQSIHDSYKKGNKKYKIYLEAIKGRLQQAHIDSNSKDTYAIMKYVAEAGYALSQKDYDSFLDWYDTYFSFLRHKGNLKARSFRAPINNLLYVTNNLTPQQIKRCIAMIDKGLKLDPLDISLILYKGDLFVMQKETKKALKVYNVALETSKGLSTRKSKYYHKKITKKIKDLN